jgi:hypothetical protein
MNPEGPGFPPRRPERRAAAPGAGPDVPAPEPARPAMPGSPSAPPRYGTGAARPAFSGQRPPPSRRPARHGHHLSSIANSASQALHGLGGLHTVLKSAANGDRPVPLHVPPRADRGRPFEVVLFFHGKGAQLDELFAQGELADRLREHGRREPNTLFVFPQGHVRERYHLWMNRGRGESLARLLDEALSAAARMLGTERVTVGRLVLKAHSSGGVVFKNAVEAGELRADRIDFYDAMYGNWGDLVAQWALRPENARVELGVVYSPHQQAQVRSFRKALSGQRTMHIERARVGHSQLPFHYWLLRPPGR